MICPHFWSLSDAQGQKESKGTCKLCGETKVFENYCEADFRVYPDRFKIPAHVHSARKPVASSAFYEST